MSPPQALYCHWGRVTNERIQIRGRGLVEIDAWRTCRRKEIILSEMFKCKAVISGENPQNKVKVRDFQLMKKHHEGTTTKDNQIAFSNELETGESEK